jgi:DNA (cytosine-5)-methyltransferase 1
VGARANMPPVAKRSVQCTIGKFLKSKTSSPSVRPTKFVDLFAGIGGASTGAAAAGLEVVLAVDSWQEGLDAHEANHPTTTHLCVELPPAAPLPLPDAPFHLHGSPPCTKLSTANQSRNSCEKRDALALVRWYVDYALASPAASWSMEQVPTPPVLDLLKSYRHPDAPRRDQLDYEVFDFHAFGVPQNRRRVIAGSPHVVARLRRLRATPWRRCARDVLPNPRGTHTRSLAKRGGDVRRFTGAKKRVYQEYDDDDNVRSIDGPAHSAIASYPLRWATPGTGTPLKVFTPDEMAALQCFPPGYVLPKGKVAAVRGVGNALPPVVMQAMLSE